MFTLSTQKHPARPQTINSKAIQKIFIIAILIFLAFSPPKSTAQVATGYTFSQGTVATNPASTSSGTAIISGWWDDNVSLFNFPAGFTFNFNGTNYTSCRVSSNGFITFGATAPTGGNYTPISSNAGYAGAFGAWSADLIDLFNSPVVYNMTGTAPNRTLTIKWFQATRYAIAGIGPENISFVINMYETTNIIEAAYGNCSMTTDALSAQVGLRGTGNSDFNHRNMTTNNPWLNNTALATTNAQSVRTRSNSRPSNLYTYFRWTPACIPPSITSLTFTNPTTCGGSNGTITINGTALTGNYTVTYTSSLTGTTTTGNIAAAANSVTITGLPAATYTNFSIKAAAATCSSNTLAGPVVLVNPTPPNITALSFSNPTTCGGSNGTITITGTSLTGNYTVTYTSSLTGNVTTGAIAAAGNTVTVTGLPAATYTNFSIKSSTTLCTSNTLPGPLTLTDPAGPNIIGLSSTGPTTCGGSDGTITISGTSLAGNYTVTYTSSLAGTVTTGSIASAGNTVTVSGLPSATYTNISIKSLSTLCFSNILAGPVVLTDPAGPSITGLGSSGTTTCGGSDGSITVTGIALAGNYTVTYTSSLTGTNTSGSIASVANTVTVTGLPAASYTNISVKSLTTQCASNILTGPVDILDPTPPLITGTTTTSTSTCGGSDGSFTVQGLLPNTAYDLYYNNAATALNIITDALGDYTVTGLPANNYINIYVVRNNCTSNVVGPAVVSDPAPPAITGTTTASTTSCGGSDGSFTIQGLLPNTAYDLYYNNAVTPVNIITDALGNYTENNLPANTYVNIYVVRIACTSNIVGPLVINDPAPPVISGTTSGGPSTCSGSNGYVALQGLLPNTNYQVSYDDGTNAYTPTIMSDATGAVIITGLPAGTYNNFIVTLNNCVSNNAGSVTISDPNPPVVTANTNAPICEGQTLVLSSNVTLNGNPAVANSYSWTGPAFVNPVNQANPTVPNAPASATGVYTVTATIANCVSAPFTIPVTVYAAPAPPTFAVNTPLCSGNDLHMDVTGADPNLIYIWTGPGLSSPDTTTNSTVPNAQTPDAGMYNLSVVNPYGCGLLVPSTVSVIINQTPPAPVPDDMVYCQTDISVALTATPANPADTLKWYTVPVGGLGTDVAPIPGTSVPGTFTWYVSETTQPGCEGARALQTVLIKPKPLAPITGSPAFTYCQFDSTAVPLVATGDSLKWYTVPTGGTAADTAPIPPTDVPGVTVWYVTQTIDGCESNRLPISVTIIPKPEPPLTQDVRYCQYDSSIALTAVGQNLKWYNSSLGGVPLANTPVPPTDVPAVTTWYVSQTVNGCESDLAPLKVTVYYKPTADIISSRDEVCQGDTLLITYVGNGSNTTSYNWQWPVGSIIENGSGQGPYIVRFNAVGTFDITLVASENGCFSPPATHSIKVKQTPTVSLNVRNNIVCTDDPVYTEISMVDMEVQDYTWNIDGAHTSDGATEISGQGPYYLEWSNPGQHIVSLNITAKDQCDTKVSDTLMVHERPEAKIGSSATDVVCEGSDIELSASINNSKYQYKWAPLQMFDYDYNSPIVKVHADRSVYVSLEVTNEYGCTSMDSIMINTKPCCELLLPTAFSPNGDGKNDLFRILNPGRHKLESLKVFNRYGQEVYTTSDENAGWDGSYNGVAQDMGVYQYLVKFKCEGKDTYQKGDVTLVR